MNEPDNNRSDNLGERQESYTDPYISESSADIYTTPEVVETVEETSSAAVVDTHGLFSGKQPENPNPANSDFYSNYSSQSPYGNGQQGNAYGSQPPYGNGQQGNVYGSQPPYGNGQQGNVYGGQSPYGNGQQGNNYGSQPSYGNSYQQNGGYGGQPPFGGQPPYDNPYSPYAMPQKKQHTGLIVGIVITIVILFLIAVFALAGKVADLLSEKEKEDLRRDVYEFDDDYDYDYDVDDDIYDDYDDDFGYDYDDYYYDDYDYENDPYYTLHDELRYDLSYEVDFEYYDYETEYENVIISAVKPMVLGDEVTNQDKINEEIQEEIDEVIELFEEEYEAHVKENEDAYFTAALSCYAAYMDEDRLSIVYDERIDTDMGGGVYLICVNVDMKNGVVLDNEDMLSIDDEFTVDFRTRSDEQNGEIEYLTYMTDQQITDYFNSENLIVFYTPKGMEIGFNYEEGWVTVTYEDYEQYLNVF